MTKAQYWHLMAWISAVGILCANDAAGRVFLLIPTCYYWYLWRVAEKGSKS